MSKSSECVVLAGPEIQLQWSPADDGSILLTIRHCSLSETSNPTVSETSKGDRKVLSFQYPPQHRDEGETLQKLRRKIENNWKTRTDYLDEYNIAWTKNPRSFFGWIDYGSSEQWSFRALHDTDNKADIERNTLHRLNLAQCFQRRKNRDMLLETDIKRAMLEDIDPNFIRITEKEQRNKMRSLDRHLEQGETLWLLWRRKPGLVITIGPMMSRDELKSVATTGFENPHLEWLSCEKLEKAGEYDKLAKAIFAYMNGNSGESESHPPSSKRRRLDPFQSSPYDTFMELQPCILPSITSFDNSAGAMLTCMNHLGNTDLRADVSYLLRLFHALGGSNIPSWLLKHGGSPQQRWADDGQQFSLMPSDAGLDRRLVDILTDPTRVSAATKELSSVIKTSVLDGSPVYSLDNSLQTTLSTQLSDEAKREWLSRALKLICFAFPREQVWEPNYASVARGLRPLLNFALQNLTQDNIISFARVETAEALLAASKLGNISGRESAIARAAEILGTHPPEYLCIEIAHQESVLARLRGDYEQSDRAIRSVCRLSAQSETEDPSIHRFYRGLRQHATSQRIYAQYGRLHVSHLENLVQSEKYAAAIDEIDDWTTRTSASLMELSILPRKSVVISKIFRSQGRFQEARQELEKCLKTMLPHDSNRYQVLSNLADAYSDMGLPEKACEVLLPEVKVVNSKPRKGKPYRRILVAMVDAHIEGCRYTTANDITQELEAIFSSLATFDVSDELLHMRVLIAGARICHFTLDFPKALGRWLTALLHLEQHRSFEAKGYIYAVIHLSISLLQLQLDNVAEARKAFDSAASILGTGITDFWIPCLAGWRRHVENSICSAVGWSIAGSKKT